MMKVKMSERFYLIIIMIFCFISSYLFAENQLLKLSNSINIKYKAKYIAYKDFNEGRIRFFKLGENDEINKIKEINGIPVYSFGNK